MGGIAALVDVYNPLAKKDEPQDVVKLLPRVDTTSCVEEHQTSNMDQVPLPDIKVIGFVKIPMQSWRDSDSVSALSNYLKVPAGRGIQMIVENDSFRLRFNPGLRPDRDPDAWLAAKEAYVLLLDALDDLIELKDLGLFSPEPAGPSGH